MIHKVVKYLLENDSSFNAAIGDDGEGEVKIYPLLAPQQVSPPFCTYELEGFQTQSPKEEISGFNRSSFVVRVYDYTFDNVMDLADLVKAALEKATAGTYNGVTLKYLDYIGMNDGYINQDTTLFYIEQTYEAVTA